MKKSSLLCVLLFILTALAQEANSKLLYADFEKLTKEKKLMSAREGQIIFDANSQDSKNRPKVTPRLLGAQEPLSQRIGFEFEITKPNEWANAWMKVVGLKDKGRLDDWAKTLIVKAEDLSTYNFLSLEIGAAGITQVKIELQSEGNGIDVQWASPAKYLEVNAQLKPYKIPLSEFKQPDGNIPKRIATTDLLKKLTSVQIGVSQVPSKGFIVVDNIAFEK
jgi:hypothetical protein